MKIFLLILIFALPNLASFAKGDDMLEVRKAYYLAVDNEQSLKAFENLLINFKNPDNTILGYIGMSFMLKAKYAWLPNINGSTLTKGRNFWSQRYQKTRII